MLFFTLQVAGSTSKADFACGVIRGLGGNLNLTDRTLFAKEVRRWMFFKQERCIWCLDGMGYHRTTKDVRL